MVLLMLPLAAQAVPASYTAQVLAGSGTRNLPGPSDHNQDTDPVGAFTSSQSSVAEKGGIGGAVDSFGASTGTARTGPGRIELTGSTQGRTSAFNVPSVGMGGLQGYGQLNDNFVIHADGCFSCSPGSLGMMTFAVAFDGKLSGAGSVTGDRIGSAQGGGAWHSVTQWRSYFNIQAPSTQYTSLPWNIDAAATSTHREGTELANSVQEDTGLGSGVHTFELAFRFDDIVSLQWLAYLYIDGGVVSSGNETNFAGETASEARSSLTWAGIQDIRDASGRSITRYTAFNDRQVDYRQSFVPTGPGGGTVPEPASLGLVLGGLLCSLALARPCRPGRA